MNETMSSPFKEKGGRDSEPFSRCRASIMHMLMSRSYSNMRPIITTDFSACSDWERRLLSRCYSGGGRIRSFGRLCHKLHLLVIRVHYRKLQREYARYGRSRSVSEIEISIVLLKLSQGTDSDHSDNAPSVALNMSAAREFPTTTPDSTRRGWE